MKKIYILLTVLSLCLVFIYYSCNTGGENLKVTLVFQSNEYNDIGRFIYDYAKKVVVSVYGNNFVPIKKSVDFPSSPNWACLSDGGYYVPDVKGFYEGDIYFPPSCDWPDRQFVKVTIAVGVPVGTQRSVVVELLNKDGNVTFRGSKDNLTIEDNTSVDITVKPIAKINFDLNEIRDIENSTYESANSGRLSAYYFERGKRVGADLVNQATILGEQEVTSDRKNTLEFAYSGEYYEYNMEEQKQYLCPTLFGYYEGENDTISFVMPGLAESLGYGLEPGGSYDMSIYAALRDKIKENPVLTAVTPSQINYTFKKDIYGEYGSWDWMYIYLSYIHGLPEDSILAIRAKIKVDFLNEVKVFSTNPEGGEQPFPNEVFDIGHLSGIADKFYMGFRNIGIDSIIPNPNFENVSKFFGDIYVSMEFETNNNVYKTNEIKIKYNIPKETPGGDIGSD